MVLYLIASGYSYGHGWLKTIGLVCFGCFVGGMVGNVFMERKPLYYFYKQIDRFEWCINGFNCSIYLQICNSLLMYNVIENCKFHEMFLFFVALQKTFLLVILWVNWIIIIYPSVDVVMQMMIIMRFFFCYEGSCVALRSPCVLLSLFHFFCRKKPTISKYRRLIMETTCRMPKSPVPASPYVSFSW